MTGVNIVSTLGLAVLLAQVSPALSEIRCTTNGGSVNCDGAGLTSIPRTFPPSDQAITSVTLDNNEFEILSIYTMINLPSTITRLSMQACRIVDVEYSAFERLHAITYLDLSANKNNKNGFLKFPAQALIQLSNLQSLLLSENLFKSLPNDAFDNMSELKLLDLSANQISEFPAQALNQLSNLQSLLLAENPFQSVPNDAFDNMSELKRLVLPELNTMLEFPASVCCRLRLEGTPSNCADQCEGPTKLKGCDNPSFPNILFNVEKDIANQLMPDCLGKGAYPHNAVRAGICNNTGAVPQTCNSSSTSNPPWYFVPGAPGFLGDSAIAFPIMPSSPAVATRTIVVCTLLPGNATTAWVKV